MKGCPADWGRGGPEGVLLDSDGRSEFRGCLVPQLLLPMPDGLQRVNPCGREPRRGLPSTPDCHGLDGEIDENWPWLHGWHAPC